MRQKHPLHAIALGIALLCVIVSTKPALAWGPLGHRMVAETATLLLSDSQPKGWGGLLARHRFEMGYYAILPDAQFRFKDKQDGAIEGPTHYFDIDLALGLEPGAMKIDPTAPKKLETIPRGYADAQAWLAARMGKYNTTSLGSAPWRVSQLLELAWQEFKNVKQIKGGYQRGAASEGDAQRIYKGIYILGVMSHYSGDSTMPYHATSDWNGWKTGQGGIHFYYESDCVNTQEPGLSTAVLASARANRKRWLAGWHATGTAAGEPPAGVMMRVFLDGYHDLTALARLDREKNVVTPSNEVTKKPAVRKPEGCKTLRPMLVDHLAKGAVLTAYLWDRVLPKAVDFSAAESLQFADFLMTPDYITPVYDAPTFLGNK